MARVVLSLFILGAAAPLTHEYQTQQAATAAYQGPLSQPQQGAGPTQPLRNPPIPNSLGYYQGSHQQIDPCARDEVLVRAACHRLLTRGPCAPDEYVLLDPADQTGFCAARLCAPDRIFVFSDQLCHDPLTTELCPLGRQLYLTAYGTPLCQCPDGTYEADDDLDDDVCQPLLGHSPSCPPSQVLWFVEFNRPPECLPDPCGGKNLGRGSNDLPFVPSAQDGKCYQLGQGSGVCPAQTWYSLALQTLRGVCVNVEDAGYQVFDEATLDYLTQQYGSFITRESVAPTPDPVPGTALGPDPSPASASFPTPAQAPESAPDPVLFSVPEPALQTPGPTSTDGEPPPMFASRQGAVTQAGQTNYEISGSINQTGIQDPLSTDQQESASSRITGQESYGQKYTGREESTDQGPTGLARTEQGRVAHHQAAGGQQTHGQTEASMSVQQMFDRNFHQQGSIARGPESEGQQGSSSVILEHGEAHPRSPGQGLPQPTDPSREDSHNGHLPHITSKLPHPQHPPTHYSHLPESSPQPPPTHYSHLPEPSPQPQLSPVFPSHSHQQYFQAFPPPSPPTYLSNPNQRPQTFPTSSSSSLPTSSALPPATHYSHPGQFQASPFSSSSLRTFRPFTLHNQSASSSPHPLQASETLSPRLLPHLPTFSVSPPAYLAPASLEHQQMSLEVFQTPDGGVLSNLDLAGSWNAPLRGFPLADDGSPEAHEYRGSSSGASAAWGQEQLYPQLQQHQQHRGRRSSLPHASPGNVIEPLLAACRAGAQRDVNAKCRDTVLPSSTQVKREVRAAPPVPPRPTCPEGQAYDRKRNCVSSSEAINSINAFNLGK